MNVIDRFTRDEVSANIWWPLAVILLALCILTVPGQNRAEDRVRSDAAQRDVAFAAAMQAPLEQAPGDTSALVAEANDLILQEDPPASQVRGWTPEGRLIFSTDPADQVGSGEAFNDEQLATVINSGSQVDIVTSTDLGGEASAKTFVTYTPVVDGSGSIAAVLQVDYPEAVLLDHVDTAWLGYRLVTGILGLLVLGLGILALREPVARTGAGVRVTPEMVPPGQSLIETDELVTLKESGAAAKRRVASMEDRVRVAEEERWKLEGQVQHLLSASSLAGGPMGSDLATPPARPTSSGRPAPALQPIAVEAVEPPVTVIPEAASSPAEAAAGPKAEPRAKAKKKAKAEAEPEVTSTSMTEPEPVQSEPEPAAEATPEPEPVVQATPEPGPVVGAALPAEPEPSPPAEPEPVVQMPAPEEVVRVPEPQRVTAGASSGEESPVDILERFLSTSPGPEPVDDPSIMRARLARTADLKKPGSRERRERRLREEGEQPST